MRSTVVDAHHYRYIGIRAHALRRSKPQVRLSHRTPSYQPSSCAIQKKVDAATALGSRGLPCQFEQYPRFFGKPRRTTLTC